MLFPKGARAAEEIEAARTTWTFGLEITSPDSPILVITNPHRMKAHA